VVLLKRTIRQVGLAAGIFRERSREVTHPTLARHGPGFAISAVRGGIAQPAPPEQQARQQALREAFTPTRPQRSFRRVAGRKAELLRILQAIAQERAHVVLYGDRGRGKTSLVNLVAAAASSYGYMVGRYACAFDSDFDEIMRGLARDLPQSLLAVPAVQDELLEGCEGGFPAGRLQPRDVALFPGRLAGRHLLLIIDEFDRVIDPSTRTRLADTIKQVSDRGAAVSFVILGVSDSLEELLGRHPSIQRNVIGVPTALLSDAEIQEILELGSREAKIDFPAKIRTSIAFFARGVPYIAHLLALHAGDRTLSRGANVVDEADLDAAILRAVAEIDPRLALVYEQLTDGGQDLAMRDLLWSVASGEQDRFGRFTVIGCDHGVKIGNTAVTPARWSRLLESGAVRACPTAGPNLHTFSEAMLPHYILLRTAMDRLVRRDTVPASNATA
jgi:Cdc6-like AAA superfamily ATPase